MEDKRIACDNCGCTFPPDTSEVTLPEHGCSARAERRRVEERTVVYPTVTHMRQAEAAVAAMAETIESHRRIDQVLALAHGNHVEQYVLIGDDALVQVHRPCEEEPYTHAWSIIRGGREWDMWFPSQDLALLALVELRNSGGRDRGGYLFAARALRVPVED